MTRTIPPADPGGSVGILAGGGPLPGRVAEAIRAGGRTPFVIAFEGYAEPSVVAPFRHEWARPAAAGRILALLRRERCSEIVLIGPVKRPGLRDLRPDAEGARILARVGRAFFAGDDGLLAALVRVFGEEGFAVRGAHEYLRDLVVVGPGPLGRHRPDDAADADIARGVAALAATAGADIGQGCVVQQGAVLALEAIEGTDRMLGRVREVALPGPGGVLVKTAKTGQDRRADLPTIGPETVRRASAAGLRGIAFEAGATLVTDVAATIATADALGLFVVAVDVDGDPANEDRSHGVVSAHDDQGA